MFLDQVWLLFSTVPPCLVLGIGKNYSSIYFKDNGVGVFCACQAFLGKSLNNSTEMLNNFCCRFKNEMNSRIFVNGVILGKIVLLYIHYYIYKRHELLQ